MSTEIMQVLNAWERIDSSIAPPQFSGLVIASTYSAGLWL